jgi:hypothetical protein
MYGDEDIWAEWRASSRFDKVMMLDMYVLQFMVPSIVVIY